jgi:SepF-like predicted cell division protein (DUF552 family)
MGNVDENLSDALNLPKPEPAKEPTTIQTEVKSVKVNRVDADRDYSEVRDNLKRAYEVVAQLISASLEANNKLMHLHKQIKDIKKEEPGKTTNVTNNSIFVGNTADLQKMIRNMNNKMIADQTENDDASQTG